MIQYENYIIEPDIYNWIMTKKGVCEKGKREGEEKQTVIGYFPSIQSCLSRIKDIKLKEGFSNADVVDLDQAIAKFDEILNKHEEVMKSVLNSLAVK